MTLDGRGAQASSLTGRYPSEPVPGLSGVPMSPLESPPSDIPTRVCRRCSAQGQTNDLNCPHCGASYLRGFKGRKRGTRVALVALPLLLVLGGAGGAAAMKVHHDNVA